MSAERVDSSNAGAMTYLKVGTVFFPLGGVGVRPPGAFRQTMGPRYFAFRRLCTRDPFSDLDVGGCAERVRDKVEALGASRPQQMVVGCGMREFDIAGMASA